MSIDDSLGNSFSIEEKVKYTFKLTEEWLDENLPLYEFVDPKDVIETPNMEYTPRKLTEDDVAVKYEIDSILTKEPYKEDFVYYIKWTGYKEATWEDVEKFSGTHVEKLYEMKLFARDAISKFLREDQEDYQPFDYAKKGASGKKQWDCLEIEANWNKVLLLDKRNIAPLFLEYWSPDPPKKLPKFTFITEMKYGPTAKKEFEELDPSKYHKGCGKNCGDCTNCYCATYETGKTSAYKQLDDGSMVLRDVYSCEILECDERCGCDPAICKQRVVQKGRQYPLVVFFEGKKGWGVRAAVPIPKGAFVTDYIGELLTDAEYGTPSKSTYAAEAAMGTLNAKYYGNESRFCAHSCDPNMRIVKVMTSFGARDGRWILFALKNIKAGQEITWDYHPCKELRPRRATDLDCLCGTKKCRGYIKIV